MSIDDDYFDIDDHFEKLDMYPVWDRYAKHTAHIENENEELRKQNNDLRNAIRVMIGIKTIEEDKNEHLDN